MAAASSTIRRPPRSTAPSADYVFVHEFGHHFAALADEYYTSDVAYETGAAPKLEPWEPNVTALADPAALKWRDLVAPARRCRRRGTRRRSRHTAAAIQERRREIRKRNAPEAEMDALFREEREWSEKLLGGMKYSEHGRRVRRRLLRGARPLPAGGRLHHVHARPRRLLPRLPARDRHGSSTSTQNSSG